MLNNLICPKTKEQILLYLAGRNQGYAREIAEYYKTSLSPIQNQLTLLENAGIIYGSSIGRTIVFRLNPRYTFYKELTALLERALEFLPVNEKEQLLMNRKRPRKRSKPL
ncbi:MAG: winged helix-turn-helix transcriptional regulator [Ignavibacteria bacterium]|nr:winged helix-turn-helix transcriptional regulator [Ignavibacteria bacterium]